MKTFKFLIKISLFTVLICLIGSSSYSQQYSDKKETRLSLITLNTLGQVKGKPFPRMAYDPSGTPIVDPNIVGDDLPAPVPGCEPERQKYLNCMKRCDDFGRPKEYCKSRFCINQFNDFKDCAIKKK